MDFEEAIELCNSILEDIPDLPEIATEFSEGVEETVLGIKGNIERTNMVTAGQEKALGNMRAAVDKWLHR